MQRDGTDGRGHCGVPRDPFPHHINTNCNTTVCIYTGLCSTLTKVLSDGLAFIETGLKNAEDHTSCQQRTQNRLQFTRAHKQTVQQPGVMSLRRVRIKLQVYTASKVGSIRISGSQLKHILLLALAF